MSKQFVWESRAVLSCPTQVDYFHFVFSADCLLSQHWCGIMDTKLSYIHIKMGVMRAYRNARTCSLNCTGAYEIEYGEL